MAAQAAFQPSRRPKSGYSEYIEPPLRSPDDSKRASIVSSTTNGGASDFETAPNTPYEGSEQGSEHTVAGARDPDLEPSPVDGPTINPIHILATQSGNPEAHVVKVSKDRVVIREGPPSEPFVQRVTHAIENYGLPPPTTTAHLPSQAQAVYKPSTATVAQGEFGPTPPATPPPAAHNLPQTDVSPVPSYFTQKHSSQKSEGNAETTSSPPIPQPSSSPPPIHQRRSPPQKSFTQPPHLIEMQRATTFAGAGTLTSSPIAVSYSEPLPSGSSPRGLGQGSTSSNGSIAKHLSYLEAPAITVTRPTRRNTISSPRPSRSLQETHAQLTQVGPGGSAFENGEIEEDILLMADQIRRERRRKAAHEKELERQEAEEMKEVQIQRRLTMDDKPLVGNLVGINHVNYVLMYNMLTGIRVAVSYDASCDARKVSRSIYRYHDVRRRLSVP
jgi:1-phosphatidylinositol-4-phosphate 5-kinase